MIRTPAEAIVSEATVISFDAVLSPNDDDMIGAHPSALGFRDNLRSLQLNVIASAAAECALLIADDRAEAACYDRKKA